MYVYEALLSQRESIERVLAARQTITRLGGSVKLAPPTVTGMVLVTLVLPPQVRPEEILPGLPFYPV